MNLVPALVPNRASTLLSLSTSPLCCQLFSPTKALLSGIICLAYYILCNTVRYISTETTAITTNNLDDDDLPQLHPQLVRCCQCCQFSLPVRQPLPVKGPPPFVPCLSRACISLPSRFSCVFLGVFHHCNIGEYSRHPRLAERVSDTQHCDTQHSDTQIHRHVHGRKNIFKIQNPNKTSKDNATISCQSNTEIYSDSLDRHRSTLETRGVNPQGPPETTKTTRIHTNNHSTPLIAASLSSSSPPTPQTPPSNPPNHPQQPILHPSCTLLPPPCTSTSRTHGRRMHVHRPHGSSQPTK